MKWQVGRVYPVDGRRGLQSGHTDPTWYALLTPPQKEAAAREYLKAQGIHAFFPNEERKWKVRGKQYTRKRPIVGGYVFARFTGHPQWHVIRDRPFFSGVVAIGITPFAMPRTTIRRLQGLTVEAEERRREKADLQARIREALAPQAGQRAAIKAGPLEGFTVNVLSISDGKAFYTLPGGLKGSAPISDMVREGVDLEAIPGYHDD